MLIRHAESTANVGKKTFYPETIELTETGKMQAKEIAEKITDKPDLVVTSPFIRTLRTAEPLLSKFPETKHEQWQVQEFTYISPLKCHNTTMEDRIPLAMEYWEKNDPYYEDGKGAESFASFITRVADCKAMIKNRPENYIIVFSHYQFIAAFNWLKDTSRITKELMGEFRQYLFNCQIANASITEAV